MCILNNKNNNNYYYNRLGKEEERKRKIPFGSIQAVYRETSLSNQPSSKG